jgi:hypothetical protein
MSAVYVPQVLASQRVAGTLFNTYTSAKSVINVTELYTFPANYLNVGSKLRISMMAGLSNIVTSPGTVTFQVMMGSIVVATSGAIQMSTTAHTLQTIRLQWDLRLDSAGSGTAAKFMHSGEVKGLSVELGSGVADPTVSDDIIVFPSGAPAVGTGFDSTIADILDFWVGFSTSNSGNGIQVYDYLVELLSYP